MPPIEHPTTLPPVALLGLGTMGSGIARSLLRAGIPLTVYNRTAAKAEPLLALGARGASSPVEAVRGARVVLSMVADDRASRAVWLEGGALDAVPEDAVLVECSTLSLAWTHELGRLATERGLSLLDAPVGGSKNVAEAGQLKVYVGGSAAGLAQVRPVLEAFAADVTHVGPSGSGTVMKLIVNQMLAVQAVALAEGLVLAERAGLEIAQVTRVLSESGVGSPVVRTKAPVMVNRTYQDVHFALRLLHKDTTYALEVADEYGVPQPTLAVTREVLRLARNQGYEDQDFAAVIEALRTP